MAKPADPELLKSFGIFPEVSELTVTSVAEFIEKTPRNQTPRWLYRGQSFLAEPIPAIDRPLAAKMWLPDQRTERELWALQEFKRRALPLLGRAPQDRSHWEWLAIARHHGVPTQLLDWSENALAALFFAVDKPNDEKDGVVFALQASLPDVHSHTDQPKLLTELAVLRPPHFLPRIGAQASVFTAHPDGFCEHDQDSAEPIAKWPDGWPGRKLTITIRSEDRVKIRGDLLDLGIHHASMFPDLDGVGEFVSREYFGQKDMEPVFDQFRALRDAVAKIGEKVNETSESREE